MSDRPGVPLSLRSPTLIASTFILLGLFVGLYGLFPYCLGYGSVPISLAKMCYELWNGYGSWGHGSLVFPIFFFLLYLKRDDLAKVEVQGSNSGAFILAFALLLYWIGFKADVQYLGYISAQLFIGGAIIFLLGWRFFRAMLFPWAFIVFAWPFLFLDNMIAFPLRVRMSSLCFHFLNLVGLPTLLDGTALVSAPDFAHNIAEGARYKVDIADPCSGIRSLFALTMITSLYGFIILKTSLQKWVLFLSAVPLAVMGNFVRIIILTYGTLWFGPTFAVGTIDHPTWFHMGAGYFVYVVALGGMVFVGWLLERNWTPMTKAVSKVVSTDNTRPVERYDY